MLKRLVYWFFCFNDTTGQDDLALRKHRARSDAKRRKGEFN
jgi:hypothetical protein